MIALPSTCIECPMARHLHGDRFACANGLAKVVRGHFPSTPECRDAVENRPDKFVQPVILPDLQGLDPEWICDRIELALNWLDVCEFDIPDGQNLVNVNHQGYRIGYLKRQVDIYYCDRLDSLSSIDPYWLALHLVHPDYLHAVVDEIVDSRALMPDYN
jgi:hypothetical protein